MMLAHENVSPDIQIVTAVYSEEIWMLQRSRILCLLLSVMH